MNYFRLHLFLVSMILFSHSLQSYQGEASLGEEEIQVEYIGHASFKIHTNQETILLDPFADKVWIGYSFPKNLTADAIFSTHPHYDHDGGIFIKRTPYWQGKIDLFTDPGKYTIGGFNIAGIKGKHCDPYGKEFGQKNTLWKIEVNGLTIAHLGDNGPLTDENVAALKGVDILMVPIDAEYHILKKEELATVLDQIKPRVIIPMHYKIEELESRPGKPQDLGPIDPYLVGKTNVQRLSSNMHTFSKTRLSSDQQIVVFQHSPLIKPE